MLLSIVIFTTLFSIVYVLEVFDNFKLKKENKVLRTKLKHYQKIEHDEKRS